VRVRELSRGIRCGSRVPSNAQHANASGDQLPSQLPDSHQLVLEYHSNSILRNATGGVADMTLRICDPRIPNAASELSKCVQGVLGGEWAIMTLCVPLVAGARGCLSPLNPMNACQACVWMDFGCFRFFVEFSPYSFPGPLDLPTPFQHSQACDAGLRDQHPHPDRGV
jgi:hypothetical protein